VGRVARDLERAAGALVAAADAGGIDAAPAVTVPPLTVTVPPAANLSLPAPPMPAALSLPVALSSPVPAMLLDVLPEVIVRELPEETAMPLLAVSLYPSSRMSRTSPLTVTRPEITCVLSTTRAQRRPPITKLY